MGNPWADNVGSWLKESDRYLLEEDQKVLDSKNLTENFELKLLPEPYIGNREAPIYLLNLNPSVEDLLCLPDPEEIKPLQARLKAHMICNYLFYKSKNEWIKCDEYLKFKFYHLDPEYKYFQGFWWWYRKLKKLLEELQKDNKLYDSFKIAANSLFNVEYMPYHSKKYINIGCRLPSQEFNFDLVETALKENKIIIIMKGKKQWTQAITGLESHSKLYTLNSPQNSVISEKNLSSINSSEAGDAVFKRLINAMKDASKAD